jgi:hypothetical protein
MEVILLISKDFYHLKLVNKYKEAMNAMLLRNYDCARLFKEEKEKIDLMLMY